MVGTSALRSDLEFVKQLDKYRSIVQSIAESAIKAFQGHTWYLTAEMCPLVLWDDSVSSDEKKSIVDALLKTPKLDDFAQMFGNGYGEPDLKCIDITKNIQEYRIVH